MISTLPTAYTGYKNTTTIGEVRTRLYDALNGLPTQLDWAKFHLADSPKHGAAIVHENGNFEYTPIYDFVGSDVFEWSVELPDGKVRHSTVLIKVRDEDPLKPNSSGCAGCG